MKTSTSEMQNDLTKAFSLIAKNRNLVLLDVAHMGTAPFLKNLIERCNNPNSDENSLQQGNNQNSNLRALYMPLANISFAKEFVKELATKLFCALSDSNEQIAAYADKYLGEFEYDIHSRFDHDGKKRLSIDLLIDDEDTQRALEAILRISQTICQEKNCRMVICFDNVDYIEQLNDGPEILGWLQLMLSSKSNVIVVTALESRDLYRRFTEGIKSKKYVKIKLSVPSQDSIRLLVKSHLKSKSLHEPDEDYLERLSELSQSNLQVALQLVDLSIRISNNHLCVSALDDAFTFTLNNNKRFYHQRTCALCLQSRRVLKLVASNCSLSDDRARESYDLSSEKEAFKAKESLIDEGILIENGRTIQFVDPIYAHCIRRCYNQSA